MRLIIASIIGLVVFFSSTTSGSFIEVGASRCSWGPSYWCKSFKESRECSATSHCIQHVWSKQELPEDNDDVCTICKNMVKQARDTLRSKETIDELKQVFDGSCDLIPINIIADECKKLAEQFIPELVETLSSEMNPQIVCATAGLCNSARIDQMLANYKQAVNQRHPCKVCKAESEKMYNVLKKLPVEQVKDKLYEICGHMSSYSDACKATVTENFHLIYSMLLDIKDGKLCDLVGICSETFSLQYPRPTFSTSDVQCEFCEKVIQHWVDTWTANTTQAEFKEVLDGLCRRLPKPDRVSRCLHIVDDYYIPWFNFLLHEVNPQQICQLFGLCGNKDFMEIDPKSSITLLLNQKNKNSFDEIPVDDNSALSPLNPSSQLIGGYFVTETELMVNKPGCVICEYSIDTLRNWLGNNKTREEVEDAVEHLCEKLPRAVKDQCDNLVEQYGQAIIELLVNDIDSKEICSRLGLCTGDILEQQFNHHPMGEIQLQRRSQDGCALCEYGMTYLYSILNDPTDRQEIENLLDSICIRLPHSISNECEKLVAEYSDKIILMIVNNFTPDQICSELKLCSSQNVNYYGNFDLEDYDNDYIYNNDDLLDYDEELDEYFENDDDDSYETEVGRPYCTLCEYAIGEVDKLITDKKNEKEIKHVLDNICYKLSAPIGKECVKMVDEYMDDIIQLIVDEYTPHEICQELHLCQNFATQAPHPNSIDAYLNSRDSSSEESSEELEETDVEVKGGPYCVICEFVMNIVDKKIINNRTIDMVERAVQMACSYMPATIADKCEDFVDKYGDEIIRILANAELGPKEVCSAINLCNENPNNLKVVNGRRCAWGKSLWCQSMFHARACGTVDYCLKNVWN